MKTLKSMLAGIVILFACVSTQATVKPHNTVSQSDVVNMYINAITNGKTDNLDNILDNDMQFNMMRGQNVNTLNKNDLMKHIQGNAVSGVTVNTSTTVLSSDDNTAKIKVDFKYDDYVRTDILTLDKSSDWKITNVDSSTK